MKSARCFVFAIVIAGCAAQAPTQPSAAGTPRGAPSAQAAETAGTAAAGRTRTGPGTPAAGGTLRVVVPSSDRSAGLDALPVELLDPQIWNGSFSGSAELFRCCLVRTLFSHNGQSTEEGGSRLQPDLASALPDVSADGRTWTIRIKPGLHYGPPLQAIEITTHDFVRAFERLFSPVLATNPMALSYDFTNIEGAADYQAGKADSISGLETPDDHTIVIHLDEAVGDFGARLAESAAAPLPPNPADPGARFGIAAGLDDGYGRFLVSSGPYMIEGAGRIDLAVPAARRSLPAGIVQGRITLVRNPSWQASSDTLRPAYPDRIEVTLADSVASAVAALDSGRADLVWPAPGTVPSLPADVYRAFQSDPARGQAHVDPTGAARYLILNVALPPFDDIHVRKALNLVVDKKRLVEVSGGSVATQPFGHIVPDAFEDGLLLDYDPYGTPGDTGDLDAAKAEMAKSRYDTNGDGTCDATACRGVRAVTRKEFAAVATAVAERAKPLGLDLNVDVVDTQSFLFDTPNASEKNPMLIGLGFHTIYISSNPFLTMFDGRLTIDNPPDTTNLTMVGATREQLRKWGYPAADVPNVDDRVESCLPLVGTPQFQCWAEVDQYVMENVVPFVPYSEDRYVALASTRIRAYSFDELGGASALDRIALAP